MENGVSVCIPTHSGRGQFAAELVASLRPACNAVAEPVEILVVDDSGAPEAEHLATACTQHGARYLRGPAPAGAKRNLAANAARHDVLLFLDSDCLATPTLVAEHLRILRAAGTGIAGVAGHAEMHGPMTRAWRALEHSRLHNACYDHTTLYREVEWAMTCNLSVRRSVFAEVGGFPEAAFTRFGGEDVDFGTRVSAAGYRWLTAPDAVVLHRREPIVSVRQAALKLFTYGRADVFLTLRHPTHRVRHGRDRAVYGPRARRADEPPSPVLLAQGRLVDAAFFAGIAWEALRRGHPRLALVHFDYASTVRCVPRET